MKNVYLLLITLITLTSISNAQTNAKLLAATDGEISFQITTKNYIAEYSTKHVMAVWVTEDNGTFVKSLLVLAATRKYDLVAWNAASSGNEVDATTGATQSSHIARTITWDCTDIAGDEVEDGTYRLNIEYTSNDAGFDVGPTANYAFSKGVDNQSYTPSNTNSFENISITYTNLENATAVSRLEYDKVIIYPNPAFDNVYIDSPVDLERVSVFNIIGKEMNNILSSTQENTTAINISKLPTGIYIINLITAEEELSFKIIKQ